jgi:tetratricopeptide (TPR) repeat protein
MRTLMLCCVLVAAATGVTVVAQNSDPTRAGRSGGHAVFGDINVVGGQPKDRKPIKVDLTLYTEGRVIVERNTAFDTGRYRFNNIPSGIYELVAEVEGQEVARVRIDLTSPVIDDLRRDLNFALSSNESKTPAEISAADRYERNAANTSLFVKANSAIEAKHYEQAIESLRKLVAADPRDFPAWTELANVHLLQSNYAEAENEYLRALDLHNEFFPALLNLGRTEVAQQKYEVAVEVLSRAVKSHPASADGNYLLGESYLQLKKGSLAVKYLNEALRLEPKAMAEVHLRLARLYHVAGMKDKAVAEYEAFLRQRPDYKDRKQLEEYISANKKP